jgi:serine/threonine protein kinase
MSDRAAAVLSPGLRLDRYELLCPLAKGGMAEVWAGRQFGKHGFQRLVAIKTILSAHAADERARRMFLEEGRLASSIRHPNIATIYDLGDERDLLFLVLEYVEGDSVAQLQRAAKARGTSIPLAVALRIVSDTCQALHAAHELRGPDGRLTSVVQRDVSPQNILLSTAGAVKVIDFGIAKILDQVRQETTAGLIKGKLQYMAPEQALGRAVDRRADIWGAGATLYQLLSGHPPIRGQNELETLHLLTSGEPPAQLADVPAPVRAIVERALQYEPEDRFETASEMHLALERAIHELCGVVTAADIEASVKELLSERIQQRQNIVEKACKAADDRAELAAEFDAEAVQSSVTDRLVPRSVVPASSPATVLRERAPKSPARPAQRSLRPVAFGVSFGLVAFGAVLWLVLASRVKAPTPEATPAPVVTAPAPVQALPPPATPPTSVAGSPEAMATAPRPISKPRAGKSPRAESPLDVAETRK